jgi:hypothetical protein
MTFWFSGGTLACVVGQPGYLPRTASGFHRTLQDLSVFCMFGKFPL